MSIPLYLGASLFGAPYNYKDMKKIAGLFILVAVLAVTVSSCTVHENCAAYNEVELDQDAAE